MPDSAHHIERLEVEIDGFYDAYVEQELKPMIPQIIEQCFDRFNLGNRSLYIEKIELDLGDISRETLGEELRVRLTYLITQELEKLFARSDFNQYLEEARITSLYDALSAYLETGVSHFKDEGISSLFEQLLQTDIKSIHLIMMRAASSKIVMKRLFYQVEYRLLQKYWSTQFPEISKTVESMNQTLLAGLKSLEERSMSASAPEKVLEELVLQFMVKRSEEKTPGVYLELLTERFPETKKRRRKDGKSVASIKDELSARYVEKNKQDQPRRRRGFEHELLAYLQGGFEPGEKKVRQWQQKLGKLSRQALVAWLDTGFERDTPDEQRLAVVRLFSLLSAEKREQILHYKAVEQADALSDAVATLLYFHQLAFNQPSGIAVQLDSFRWADMILGLTRSQGEVRVIDYYVTQAMAREGGAQQEILETMLREVAASFGPIALRWQVALKTLLKQMSVMRFEDLPESIAEEPEVEAREAQSGESYGLADPVSIYISYLQTGIWALPKMTPDQVLRQLLRKAGKILVGRIGKSPDKRLLLHRLAEVHEPSQSFQVFEQVFGQEPKFKVLVQLVNQLRRPRRTREVYKDLLQVFLRVSGRRDDTAFAEQLEAAVEVTTGVKVTDLFDRKDKETATEEEEVTIPESDVTRATQDYWEYLQTGIWTLDKMTPVQYLETLVKDSPIHLRQMLRANILSETIWLRLIYQTPLAILLKVFEVVFGEEEYAQVTDLFKVAGAIKDEEVLSKELLQLYFYARRDHELNPDQPLEELLILRWNLQKQQSLAQADRETTTAGEGSPAEEALPDLLVTFLRNEPTAEAPFDLQVLSKEMLTAPHRFFIAVQDPGIKVERWKVIYDQWKREDLIRFLEHVLTYILPEVRVMRLIQIEQDYDLAPWLANDVLAALLTYAQRGAQAEVIHLLQTAWGNYQEAHQEEAAKWISNEPFSMLASQLLDEGSRLTISAAFPSQAMQDFEEALQRLEDIVVASVLSIPRGKVFEVVQRLLPQTSSVTQLTYVFLEEIVTAYPSVGMVIVTEQKVRYFKQTFVIVFGRKLREMISSGQVHLVRDNEIAQIETVLQELLRESDEHLYVFQQLKPKNLTLFFERLTANTLQQMATLLSVTFTTAEALAETLSDEWKTPEAQQPGGTLDKELPAGGISQPQETEAAAAVENDEQKEPPTSAEQDEDNPTEATATDILEAAEELVDSEQTDPQRKDKVDSDTEETPDIEEHAKDTTTDSTSGPHPVGPPEAKEPLTDEVEEQVMIIDVVTLFSPSEATELPMKIRDQIDWQGDSLAQLRDLGFMLYLPSGISLKKKEIAEFLGQVIWHADRIKESTQKVVIRDYFSDLNQLTTAASSIDALKHIFVRKHYHTLNLIDTVILSDRQFDYFKAAYVDHFLVVFNRQLRIGGLLDLGAPGLKRIDQTVRVLLSAKLLPKNIFTGIDGQTMTAALNVLSKVTRTQLATFLGLPADKATTAELPVLSDQITEDKEAPDVALIASFTDFPQLLRHLIQHSNFLGIDFRLNTGQTFLETLLALLNTPSVRAEFAQVTPETLLIFIAQVPEKAREHLLEKQLLSTAHKTLVASLIKENTDFESDIQQVTLVFVLQNPVFHQNPYWQLLTKLIPEVQVPLAMDVQHSIDEVADRVYVKALVTYLLHKRYTYFPLEQDGVKVGIDKVLTYWPKTFTEILASHHQPRIVLERLFNELPQTQQLIAFRQLFGTDSATMQLVEKELPVLFADHQTEALITWSLLHLQQPQADTARVIAVLAALPVAGRVDISNKSSGITLEVEAEEKVNAEVQRAMEEAVDPSDEAIEDKSTKFGGDSVGVQTMDQQLELIQEVLVRGSVPAYAELRANVTIHSVFIQVRSQLPDQLKGMLTRHLARRERVPSVIGILGEFLFRDTFRQLFPAAHQQMTQLTDSLMEVHQQFGDQQVLRSFIQVQFYQLFFTDGIRDNESATISLMTEVQQHFSLPKTDYVNLLEDSPLKQNYVDVASGISVADVSPDGEEYQEELWKHLLLHQQLPWWYQLPEQDRRKSAHQLLQDLVQDLIENKSVKALAVISRQANPGKSYERLLGYLKPDGFEKLVIALSPNQGGFVLTMHLLVTAWKNTLKVRPWQAFVIHYLAERKVVTTISFIQAAIRYLAEELSIDQEAVKSDLKQLAQTRVTQQPRYIPLVAMLASSGEATTDTEATPSQEADGEETRQPPVVWTRQAVFIHYLRSGAIPAAAATFVNSYRDVVAIAEELIVRNDRDFKEQVMQQLANATIREQVLNQRGARFFWLLVKVLTPTAAASLFDHQRKVVSLWREGVPGVSQTLLQEQFYQILLSVLLVPDQARRPVAELIAVILIRFTSESSRRQAPFSEREMKEAQFGNTFIETYQKAYKLLQNPYQDKAPRQVPAPLEPDTDAMLNRTVNTSVAGIVIFWPYLRQFFELLELSDGREFKSREAQTKGVQLLYYLATAEEQAEEHELLLCKVLCGMKTAIPVPMEFDLSEREKEVTLMMMKGATQNWEKLSKSSPEALREGFLIRDGYLTETERVWELEVEKKTVDILMKSMPWAIGNIRLPWMEKALMVDWI